MTDKYILVNMYIDDMDSQINFKRWVNVKAEEGYEPCGALYISDMFYSNEKPVKEWIQPMFLRREL